MLAKLTNNWTIFLGLIVGVFLLMFSVRPELQSRSGETGPGQKIAIVGHVLTWSAAGVLAYRMVRGIRNHGTSEEITVNVAPEPIPDESGAREPRPE
jgi:hypothetical protein